MKAKLLMIAMAIMLVFSGTALAQEVFIGPQPCCPGDTAEAEANAGANLIFAPTTIARGDYAPGQ